MLRARSRESLSCSHLIENLAEWHVVRCWAAAQGWAELLFRAVDWRLLFIGQTHSLHFSDIRDDNRVRPLSLKRDSLHLHILAQEGHKLFPLTVVRHLV